MNEITEAINHMQEEITCIDKRVKEIDKRCKTLLKRDMFVYEYAKLGEEKRKLKDERKKVKELYMNIGRRLIQSTCSHPLWYLLKSTEEDKQPYYTCVCFRCLVNRVGKPKEFKNCLRVANPSYYAEKRNDLSFESLLAKYNELKVVKPNEYYANSAMIKKYRGK